jgi:predicted dehydrogenase
LHYDLGADRLFGLSRREGAKAGRVDFLPEIAIPNPGGWRVEEDFVDSIRNGTRVRLTDFETGVSYMEFTEAVARSAQSGEVVALDDPG